MVGMFPGGFKGGVKAPSTIFCCPSGSGLGPWTPQSCLPQRPRDLGHPSIWCWLWRMGNARLLTGSCGSAAVCAVHTVRCCVNAVVPALKEFIISLGEDNYRIARNSRGASAKWIVIKEKT